MRTPALLIASLLALCAPGCDGSEFPVDPQETLTEIQREGVLRVGVADHPPLADVHDDGSVDGLEADLVEALAAELGVEVEWMPMAQAEIVEALETRSIDLGIGGFTKQTPYKKKLGLTRSYGTLHGKKQVLLVAPGENRWLVRVEHFLHDHEEELHRALMRLETREARR